MRIDFTTSQVGAEPIDIDYAKNYCKVDFDVDDDIITQAIAAARGICENYIGQSVVKKNLVYQFSDFDEGDLNNGYPVINLLRGPIQEVSAVKIINNKEVATLTTDDYQEIGLSQKSLLVKQAVTLNSLYTSIIQVEYTAGMTKVPDEIKDGIAQLVGDMYEHRQNEVLAEAPQVLKLTSMFKWNSFRTNFGL